jgi:glycosyltransferase involved in cell wall biosynthesis
MKLSVIIPVYNEELSLEACIESLGAQTHPDFEIIVVDDGSTDETLVILKNLEKTLPNFKFVKQFHRGAGAARNLGAKNAKGDVLVFVDADMTFDKAFLETLVEPIGKRDIKGTWSREEYVSNWDNVWARCWNINENWESKRRHPKNYPDQQPVFRAILKSEFDRVGGYTPGGYDDDWSLYTKLGYKAVNAPGAVFYHKNPASLAEIYNHARWVGKRRYKLGLLGYFGGLVRSSLLISLIAGIYKSIRYSEYAFIVFKIVYDFGIFIGIIEMLIYGKTSK